MKLFILFINSIFWLGLFIVPLIPATVLCFWLYDRSTKNLPLIIMIGLLAIICGVIIAERVRKKRGLASFFGTLNSTPDIVDQNVKN